MTVKAEVISFYISFGPEMGNGILGYYSWSSKQIISVNKHTHTHKHTHTQTYSCRDATPLLMLITKTIKPQWSHSSSLSGELFREHSVHGCVVSDKVYHIVSSALQRRPSSLPFQTPD